MAIFYNQATLSYNGSVTSSNITTGEIIEVLTATKNAVIDTYAPENDIVFVVSIVNTGTTDLTGLTLTDDLGSYVFGDDGTELVPMTYEEDSVNYYINGVVQPAPAVTQTEPLTISGISVPASGTAAVIYAARVNQYAPLSSGSVITNTAEITGNGICTPVTASADISPANTADLAISKSLDPTEIPENGELTYSFIIQNYGNTEAMASDTVIFRDVFEPAIKISSVQFNGTVWSPGTNYSYNETTGEFLSNEGQITVPAAVYTQDPQTGAWGVQPGASTLVISGTVSCAVIEEPPAEITKKKR